MNDNTNAFSLAYNSDEGKEILALGEKIKKLDKSNDRRLQILILISFVGMTILGYISMGIVGSVIFFLITAVSSFALYYSSKKNVLLKYLTFYRSRVPKLIAMADGTTVTAEEIPDSEFISTLSSEGKLAYRMCHRYGELYIGYAKFMVGENPILQGLLYFTEGNGTDLERFEEVLKEEFDNYTLKVEDDKAMLFIPGVEDYLNGRVEMKDDLSFPALMKQYDYYMLGKSFRDAVSDKTEE